MHTNLLMKTIIFTHTHAILRSQTTKRRGLLWVLEAQSLGHEVMATCLAQPQSAIFRVALGPYRPFFCPYPTRLGPYEQHWVIYTFFLYPHKVAGMF